MIMPKHKNRTIGEAIDNAYKDYENKHKVCPNWQGKQNTDIHKKNVHGLDNMRKFAEGLTGKVNIWD